MYREIYIVYHWIHGETTSYGLSRLHLTGKWRWSDGCFYFSAIFATTCLLTLLHTTNAGSITRRDVTRRDVTLDHMAPCAVSMPRISQVWHKYELLYRLYYFLMFITQFDNKWFMTSFIVITFVCNVFIGVVFLKHFFIMKLQAGCK
jgi:hypothetical protein